MADRPIIFSAPMVRALLDGRKTQTRRVLLAKSGIMAALSVSRRGGHWLAHEYDRSWPLRLPYAPGDRLWVREAWSGAHYWRGTKPADRVTGCYGGDVLVREDLWYWAEGNPDAGDFEPPRPSIHMPRWASRLTLTVTDVRVQRLNELTDTDAIAEGVEPDGYGGWRVHSGTIAYQTAVWAFHHLWNNLHGPDAWDANPWVCALTFTVQRGNIDAQEEG